MNKALALEVARELKLSPEKVHAICNSFHDGMKYFLTHPQESKGGIHIEGFLSMAINKYKILHSLELDSTYNVELKHELLDNLKQYKRNETKSKKGQTSEQDDNVGSHEG